MNLIKHFKLSAFLLIGLFAIFANTVSAQNKDLSKQAKITMEQARATAMTKASGTIEGEELEKENGKLVYSFDIRNARGTITEVQVDAKNGKIVSVEEENAEKEAAENQQEMAEKKLKSGDDDDDEETPAMKQANMAKYSKQAKVTLEQAKAIALKRIPGEITDADLEKERGRLQYAFDIKSTDGKVYDVEVDAKSGKILKAVLDTEDDDDEDNK